MEKKLMWTKILDNKMTLLNCQAGKMVDIGTTILKKYQNEVID